MLHLHRLYPYFQGDLKADFPSQVDVLYLGGGFCVLFPWISVFLTDEIFLAAFCTPSMFQLQINFYFPAFLCAQALSQYSKQPVSTSTSYTLPISLSSVRNSPLGGAGRLPPLLDFLNIRRACSALSDGSWRSAGLLGPFALAPVGSCLPVPCTSMDPLSKLQDL